MKEKTIMFFSLFVFTMIVLLFNGKVYADQEMDVCGEGSFKSFMPMTALGRKTPQYRYLSENTNDERNLRITEDGYYAVAMGSYYGKLGDKFVITFSNGVEVKVVKVDEKANAHTSKACYGKSMASDSSIIEPIISYGMKDISLSSSPELLKQLYFHGNVGVVFEEFAGKEKITHIKKINEESLESEKPTLLEETTSSYQSDSFYRKHDPHFLLGESDFVFYTEEKDEQWLYSYLENIMTNWYFSTQSLQRGKT